MRVPGLPISLSFARTLSPVFPRRLLPTLLAAQIYPRTIICDSGYNLEKLDDFDDLAERV